MYPIKNPKFDLKLKYRETLELAVVLTLAAMIAFFQFMPEIDAVYVPDQSTYVEINVEDIPQTEQIRNLPAPPARPSVPIPVESEDIPEDMTIASTELEIDLENLVAPPPAPTENEEIYERYTFIPYDESPFPIGGYAAIAANLKYPTIAQKAGIEARVVVGILIDKTGKALKAEILQDSGTQFGFEEAAIHAVMSVDWKPAKQRDKAVTVWVSVPIKFALITPDPTT